MKTLPFALATALLCGITSPSPADFVPDLGSAPYVVDQTIVGIDGWASRIPSAAVNPDSARLVPVRWNAYKPAIVFRSTSLANSSFPATTGERVRITFQVALTFPDQGKLREFRMWFGGGPIGEIYFDHSTGLGHHGLGTVSEGSTILPKGEVMVNSLYTFDITIDYAKQTYDIAVTGKKKDGSPFEYRAQGLELLNKGKPATAVTSLSVLCGSRVTAYLTELRIESLP